MCTLTESVDSLICRSCQYVVVNTGDSEVDDIIRELSGYDDPECPNSTSTMPGQVCGSGTTSCMSFIIAVTVQMCVEHAGNNNLFTLKHRLAPLIIVVLNEFYLAI